jgi:hypothetical protein
MDPVLREGIKAIVIQGVFFREPKMGEDAKEIQGSGSGPPPKKYLWSPCKAPGFAQAYGKFDRIGEWEESEQMRFGRVPTLVRGCDWLI